MDIGYIALIAAVVTLLIIMIQRVERKRRKLAIIIVSGCFLVMRQNAFIKGDLHEETLLAFIVGVLVSGLFWLLVGKYNPVGSSDEIRVVNMDD